MRASLTHLIGAICCFAVCGLRAATETDRNYVPQDIAALPVGFPTHWTQYGSYADFTVEEFGQWAQPGCVAIAGAAAMEALRWPDAFGEGEVIYDIPRSLRAGPVDWDSVAPAPNRPDGMRTVHDILYNLGLLSRMGYGFGTDAGVSTTPLSNLGGALVDARVGYASAYTVQLNQSATPQDTVEAVIWSSLRCGSPVPLSVNLGYGAHAVVAYGYGYGASDGNPRTAIFVGYGGAGIWSTLPVFDRAGLKDLDYALAGVVAKRPEGVGGTPYAFPILGTVQTAEGKPIPYAEVTLERDGTPIGTAVTDHAGRYGIWGWFGGAHAVRCGNAEKRFELQPNAVGIDSGTGIPRMDAGALKRIVSAHTATLTPTGKSAFTVFTGLDEALADARENNGRYILCLRPRTDAERLEIRDAVEAGLCDAYTLWYSHPEVGGQTDTMAERPTAKAFVLTPMEKVLGYCLEGQSLKDFLADGKINTPPNHRLDASAVLSGIGLLPGNDLTLADGVTLTLDGTLRVGTLTTEGDAVLVAKDAAPRLDIANLSLGGRLTVSGARLDLVPNADLTHPVTLTDGARLILKNSISLPSVTLDDAELTVASGTAPLPSTLSLSGSVSVTAADKAALTLAASSRVELGADTLLTWSAPLTGSAALTFAASDGTPSLTLQGIQSPVIVQGPARLDGGSLGGNLGLFDGAALASGRLLTVSGTVTATPSIPVSGTRVGTFLETDSLLDPAAFSVAEGFGVERTELADGRYAYRLISVGSTPPAVYADGVLTEAVALPESNRARNLLVLTPRFYKECAYWEPYAVWKSSEAGGRWTVMVASPENYAQNETPEDFIARQPADFVILGATAAENTSDGANVLCLPDLDAVPEGVAVGRIPVVPVLTLPYRAGTSIQQRTLSAEAQIAGYAAKSERAITPWQSGRMLCVGKTFENAPAKYEEAEPGYTDYDGFPPMTEWIVYVQTHTAIAMREHYKLLSLSYPERKPLSDLRFSVDSVWCASDPNTSIAVSDIGEQDGAVLWTEGSGTNAAVAATLSCALDGKTGANIAYVGDMTGLHSLALMPVGQSASMPLLTETAPTAGIGMALVLNPAGGALTALAVPEAYEAVIQKDGTVDYAQSAAHAACLNILKRLVANPQLTVGEAFAEEQTAALTLLGDPTVRIAPFTMPGWILRLK